MEKEHYEIILAVLAEKVKSQETELGYLRWVNGDLKKKLAEAENQMKETEVKENEVV